MLCVMSVHRQKTSKDKQCFIARFGQDHRGLQLLFLSDAEKSCEQFLKPGEGNRAIVPKNFKNIFSCW